MSLQDDSGRTVIRTAAHHLGQMQSITAPSIGDLVAARGSICDEKSASLGLSYWGNEGKLAHRARDFKRFGLKAALALDDPWTGPTDQRALLRTWRFVCRPTSLPLKLRCRVSFRSGASGRRKNCLHHAAEGCPRGCRHIDCFAKTALPSPLSATRPTHGPWNNHELGLGGSHVEIAPEVFRGSLLCWVQQMHRRLRTGSTNDTPSGWTSTRQGQMRVLALAFLI